jgi:hypothetical protein
MEERMTELSADEKATRITRSLHAVGVDSIKQWPIVVRDGRYGDGPSVCCGGLAKRDFGSGELFNVECGSELGGSTLAELEDVITRHLYYTEHGRHWYDMAPREPFFSVQLEDAPQVPAPPLAPPEIGA